MAKIKPVISKVSKRNIYDYFDSTLNTNIKVCGFDIDVYDNISKDRIRKRIQADFKTVSIYVEKLEKDITDISLKLNYNHILPHMTLSTFLEKFKSEKSKESDRVGKGLAKETINRYKTSVNSLINFKEDVQLSSINENYIESWISSLKIKKLSVNTINSYLKHLKSIFNWGIKSHIINVNPFAEIPAFKSKQKVVRVLTEAELNKIWEVCKPDSRWYPYIVVYLLTGARISEILKPKLRWEDVDFERNTISLRKRKRGKTSVLPLTSHLKKVLLKEKKNKPVKLAYKYGDDGDYVFPFSTSYVSRRLKKEVFKPAGLGKITVHDLRRSFASHLTYLGFEVFDISQIMAHSKTEVTQTHYLSQLPTKSRKMLEELEKHLGFDSIKVLS